MKYHQDNKDAEADAKAEATKFQEGMTDFKLISQEETVYTYEATYSVKDEDDKRTTTHKFIRHVTRESQEAKHWFPTEEAAGMDAKREAQWRDRYSDITDFSLESQDGNQLCYKYVIVDQSGYGSGQVFRFLK